MPGPDLIDLPRSQYVRLVSIYLEEHTPTLIEDMKSSDALFEEIASMTEEAKVAGIRLDDETIASDPAAADIRRRLDSTLSKIYDLQARRHALSRMAEHAKGIVKEGIDGPPVQIRTTLALSMLGLSPADLGL